jgi:ribosome biogenesis GTPase
MCRVDYQGQNLLCDIRGSIKATQTRFVNPVAVGDWVLVNRTSADRGVVESVLPRQNVLARPSSPDQGKILPDLLQIVVANVDRLLIIASWREPYLWPALIDRYLISAQRNQIEAIICINKVDLVEDKVEFDQVVDVYKNLEYKCILTSAISHQGIAPLKELLSKGTSVLAGLSGVGKSTLLTAVQPSLELKTAEVSDRGLYTGQGRHTTTQASLWRLENGGIVIDTPGIRSFGLAGILPASLSSWYPEMAPYIPNCRFNDCTHLKEPACAVKSALEMGKISPLRYKNYTQLFEELAAK